MRIFDYTKLSDCKWDSEILGLIAQIHEYKGRQERIPEIAPIAHGVTRLHTLRGTSSHFTNPFMGILKENCTEEKGECYGIQLVYSGSFAMTAEWCKNGSLTLQGGINDTCFGWELHGGEEFVTPQVLLTYSNEGLGGMSRSIHDFLRKRVIDPAYVHKTRPIVVNNWEATYFDFNNEKLFPIVDIETKGKDDAYLEIFDENGNRVDNDDNSGVGQNARIIQHLISGKTYKIKVRHSNPLRYGSTSLIIHKKDAITELGKSYSSASNGERTYSNDSIWFEFSPQSNAIYTISTGSNTSEDTYLTIYDEQYNVIAFDDDSGEGRNALIDLYLLQNKKYYIKANKYNNTSGTFTTVVTKQQMLPKYADWELSEGEYIYYRITVPDLTTGSYKMSAFARTGSTQDTYLTLLDNNFNYLTHNDDKSSSDRSSEIIYTLEAGKTYYLQLRLFSASTNAKGKIEITKV